MTLKACMLDRFRLSTDFIQHLVVGIGLLLGVTKQTTISFKECVSCDATHSTTGTWIVRRWNERPSRMSLGLLSIHYKKNK